MGFPIKKTWYRYRFLTYGKNPQSLSAEYPNSLTTVEARFCLAKLSPPLRDFREARSIFQGKFGNVKK